MPVGDASPHPRLDPPVMTTMMLLMLLMMHDHVLDCCGKLLSCSCVICGRRDLRDGRPKLYPEYNYLSGTGMSTVWMGHNHYAPHNRQWQRHDAKRALPNDRVAGQIEFTSEDQWRDWQLRRDQHDSKHCAGFGELLLHDALASFTSLELNCTPVLNACKTMHRPDCGQTICPA